MRNNPSIVSDLSILVTGLLILVGLTALGIRLYAIQMNGVAHYAYAGSRQAVRRVQTAGARGRILDCRGRVLADNRVVLSLWINPECFQRRSELESGKAILEAIDHAAQLLGLSNPLSEQKIRRHLRRVRSLPLLVWRDIDDTALARFAEHERELPGFACQEGWERRYPGGQLAAHVLGYVGRDQTEGESGDERFSFREVEMRGRSGLEDYYDLFLRGVPGEKRLLVDALGYTQEEEILCESQKGPDLTLTLESSFQKAVEVQLADVCGACVVMDPRTGGILAMASSPTYDLNDFIPFISSNRYARLTSHPDGPLWNRARDLIAPGSTFKPITALAGLRAGFSASDSYECIGRYGTIRCARRWGHGSLDVCQALRESCNPFFCHWGVNLGSNALVTAACDFGLCQESGIDLPPLGAEREDRLRLRREQWLSDELAQIAIGQGRMVASPLQMARVAAALGTGWLVTPHLRLDLPTERTRLPFEEAHLAIVREGMRRVVEEGTGRLAGLGIPVSVAGKTGTAQVMVNGRRCKNTWFIAYAPLENPTIAIAMVVQNGDSGGGTTAPKVREILKEVFGEK